MSSPGSEHDHDDWQTTGWMENEADACCGDCRKFVDCSLALSVFLRWHSEFRPPRGQRAAAVVLISTAAVGAWEYGYLIERCLRGANTDRDFFEFATDLTAAGSALPWHPVKSK